MVAESSLQNSYSVWYPKFVNNYGYKDCNRLCQLSSLQTKLSTDTSELWATRGVAITADFINNQTCFFGQIESTITMAPFRDWQGEKEL